MGPQPASNSTLTILVAPEPVGLQIKIKDASISTAVRNYHSEVILTITFSLRVILVWGGSFFAWLKVASSSIVHDGSPTAAQLFIASLSTLTKDYSPRF